MNINAINDKTISEVKTRRLEPVLTRTILSGASCLALLASMPAYAQDTGSGILQELEEDEVVATGIRSSLKSAQDIKQNADTFVDAITSEDIGALPDRSVTEALQRVPGVTISRFAAADDPDHFSIEGSDVVVRGLSYVASQFNGRETFSANNGRSLSFADVPPELLGSVQVFKNQTADLIEGGIAGTVSLETVKPFDKAGRVIAGSAELNYSDFRDKVTPTLSGLYSDRWETGAGEFGLRVNAVTSELKSRSDGSQISSFQPRTDLTADGSTVYAPEGASLRTQDYDRKRLGYGAAAQWSSNDQTMEATAEFIRSEATTSWGEHVSEIATDNVGDSAFFALPGTEFAFGADDLFTSGSLSAPTGWRSDQWSGDARTPIYGLQSNNIKRGVEEENITSDYSLNFKYSPNDDWAFNFDYQHVKSTKENLDFTLWGSTFQDLRLNTAGEVPDIAFQTPTNQVAGFGGDNDVNCADDGSNLGSNTCPTYLIDEHPTLSDPYNSFWRAAMDHTEDSEGTQNAFRADGEYKLDKGWIKDVRFGARFAERDQTTRFSIYNWGALSEIWGNNGPVWMDQIGVPEGQVGLFEWDNFQRGDVTPIPALPYYAGNPATDYDAAADFADTIVAEWFGRNGDGASNIWSRLSERPGLVDGNYLPGEISDVTEKSTAIYGMLNFGNDDPFANGMTLDGNIGLRYVETDVTSRGSFQAAPVNDIPNTTSADPAINACLDDGTQPGFQPPGICALSEAERADLTAFANGESRALSSTKSYDAFLPSFNLKLGLDEEKIVRFAYSKGLSRPDVGLLRNFRILQAETTDDPRTPNVDPAPTGFRDGFFGFVAEGGNPFLEPTTADNFDLSFEWYFDDVGSFTASVFHKRIKNIVDRSGSLESYTVNGVTYDDVFVNGPGNSPDTGKINGFEIAHQQFYDDYLPDWAEGFGTAFTYTYVDSSGIRSSGVNSTSSNPTEDTSVVSLDALPLQGLSKHNYNISAIYEKGRVSSRLSYNWRSDYLVTPRDVITPFYPLFQDDTGQLDGSFFYTLNDNIKLGVQASNLLDEITTTRALLPDSDGRRGIRSAFRNDRRFTFALRGTF